MDNLFQSVEAELLDSVWRTEAHDRICHQRMGYVLAKTNSLGFVSRIGERQIAFSKFRRLMGLNDLELALVEKKVHTAISKEFRKIRKHSRNHSHGWRKLHAAIKIPLCTKFKKLLDPTLNRLGPRARELGAFASIVFENDVTNERTAESQVLRPFPREFDDLNYVALFYDRARFLDPRSPATESRFVEYHSQRSLRTILFVLRCRERIFAPFPPEISKRYWNDAQFANSPTPLRPPFETPETPRRTVTLAFDLRKSTFCMAQADNLYKYAKWLDNLIKVLVEVAHNNGGVFGNFTGDGCIAYFLEDEFAKIYKNRTRPKKERPNVVVAALECATDMQRAISHHLQQLYPNLRMRSELLGAGIAIALGNAHWSYEYSDFGSNLVVVGPSIVDACRLCDSAKADSILMGENAYMKLPKPMRQSLQSKSVAIQTKEYGEQQRITARKIRRPWLERHYGTPAHRIAVESIYKRVIERS